ncbi:zinc-dependent alcohol dehydrogenase family protein [Acidipila sp. EB88]|uniref:zinc-dependent alcohol dehydrogenase family protein n=1 Tax=Acidipila sp. EB88 TaxID=2305226 RepID=UPI000F5D95A2|nr:zinc-dependent alcohol dehydrogenase family protein [Acidipila sp. EB88]RRA47979.1 NADPH:quinone reductase [Acidipila sp. EB88]
MSKAVLFHNNGGPEELKLEEIAVRAPAQGEVKLRVEAMGLNRAELMYLGGYYLETAKLPSRIGYEIAGVVTAVGPDVDASIIGQRFATVPGFSMNQYGCLGEEAVVPASRLARYPEKLSAAEGASVWMQYLTAYGALVRHGKVTTGDFVLITAASSSVGIAAIQIVKAEGGIAIATTRKSDKRDALLAQGADHVIVTEEEDLKARVDEITGGQGARLVFDPVGGPYVEKLAEACAHSGTIFEYGALATEPTPFPLMLALGKSLRVQGYTLHEITVSPELLGPACDYVRERLEDGRFKVILAKTFPFEQFQQAYTYLASNQQIGKVAITLS